MNYTSPAAQITRAALADRPHSWCPEFGWHDPDTHTREPWGQELISTSGEAVGSEHVPHLRAHQR